MGKDVTKTDVLIIGGGLAGAATAYFLAREGVEVTLLERADLNTQASGSNAGSIHAQIPHEPFMIEGEEWARIFAPTIPLMLASIRLWQGLEAELGCDLEFSLGGGLLVGESEAQLRDIERKARIERAQGLEVEMLDKAELHRRAPYLVRAHDRRRLLPDRGQGQSAESDPRLRRRRPAPWRDDHDSSPGDRRWSAEDGGYRVETAAGSIRARRVVNAAGAEAGRISAMLGLELPIQGHPIQVNVTEPVAPLVKHLVYFAGEKLTLKQARNGSFLIGGGWPARWSQRSGHSANGRWSISIRSAPISPSLSMWCRPWPRCGCCGSGRPSSTAPRTGSRSWARCPGFPGFS